MCTKAKKSPKWFLTPKKVLLGQTAHHSNVVTLLILQNKCVFHQQGELSTKKLSVVLHNLFIGKELLTFKK